MLDSITKQYISTLIENEFKTIIDSHTDKYTNILRGIDLKDFKTSHFEFIYQDVIAEKEFDNTILYLVKLINKDNIPPKVYTTFVTYLKSEKSSLYCTVREYFSEDDFVVDELVIEKIFVKHSKSNVIENIQK